MYPISNIELPEAYQKLNQSNKKLLMNPMIVHESKKDWINEWLNSQ